jgi:hypothetical protein
MSKQQTQALSEALEPKITAIWADRMSQRIESALYGYAALKRELRIPHGELRLDDLPATLAPRLKAEVALLEVSMGRALGKSSESEGLLNEISQRLGDWGLDACARFDFERGLFAFVRGEYASALDCFLRAREGAQGEGNIPVLIMSLLNTLFCLENLGLPWKQSFEELKTQLAKKEIQQAVRHLSQPANQLLSFEQRQKFRNGEIDKAFWPRASANFGQSDWHALWVAELPYVIAPRKTREALTEKLALAPAGFYQKSYRLRTLNTGLHPADLSSFRAQDLVDRFYLWTWRWLCSPDKISLEVLLSLFEPVDWPELTKALTIEDRQLLRNALLWLDLFDSEPVSSILPLLERLEPGAASPAGESQLLSFEYLVVHYFAALKRGESKIALRYLSELKTHPLWTSHGLRFRELVEKVSSPGSDPNTGPAQDPSSPLGALAKRLAALLSLEPTLAPGTLYVDLEHKRIVRKASSALSEIDLISEPLCLGFELLMRRPTVSAELFLETCFGIRRYEPVEHNLKIHNLLARMRSLTGNSIRFGLKSKNVFAKGDWRSLKILRAREINSEDSLAGNTSWRKFSLRAQRLKHPARAVTKLEVPQQRIQNSSTYLSRSEVEGLIRKSRATTNRLLLRWEQLGWVKRQGQARATRYLLAQEAWNEI